MMGKKVTFKVNPRLSASSAFKQQRLPAWQPVLSIYAIVPTFLLIGAGAVGLGIWLVIVSRSVFELSFDYTDCLPADGNSSANMTCNEIVIAQLTSAKPHGRCRCVQKVNISKDVTGPIFVYYSLTNFYQSYRRFAKSRDDAQLSGMLIGPAADCDPLQYDNTSIPNKILDIVPCGALANSLFNDSIKLYTDDNVSVPVPFTRTEIAWPSDISRKFKNPMATQECRLSPSLDPDCWSSAFNHTAKPPAWEKPVWLLDRENPNNTGFENEDLMVWMRMAATPNFRKLYAKIDGTLRSGSYSFVIDYAWVIRAGLTIRKGITLSTTTWLGGRNDFLGYAYIVVGIMCLLLGAAFIIIHWKSGKSLAELSDISATETKRH